MFEKFIEELVKRLFAEQLKKIEALIDKKISNQIKSKKLFVGEAAAFLGITEEYLRKLANKGIVQGYKPGGVWFFFEDDLVKYIKSRKKLTVEDEMTKLNERLKKRHKST